MFSQRRRRRRRRIRDHRFQHIHTPGCPYAAHGGKCVGWLRGRVHRCEVLERTPAHARRRTCYTSVVYTSLSIYICVCVCIYMYLSYSVFLLFPSLYCVLFSTRSRTTGGSPCLFTATEAPSSLSPRTHRSSPISTEALNFLAFLGFHARLRSLGDTESTDRQRTYVPLNQSSSDAFAARRLTYGMFSLASFSLVAQSS